VFAKALQPVEAAALITAQPEKAVASGKGGEILPEILGILLTRGAQLEQALLGRCGQGKVGFLRGHGEGGQGYTCVIRTFSGVNGCALPQPGCVSGRARLWIGVRVIWVMLSEMGVMVFMAFWEVLATPEGVVFDQLSQGIAGKPDRY